MRGMQSGNRARGLSQERGTGNFHRSTFIVHPAMANPCLQRLEIPNAQ
jgi:hypothetical protein